MRLAHYPALLVALAGSSAADVVNVSMPGATFGDLQPAIDAASDGDVLLVGEGTYSTATIDGKSLTITVTGSERATVDGTLTIENLSGSQSVHVVGLDVIAPFPTASPPMQPAVLVRSCDGTVSLEECELRAARGEGTTTDPFGNPVGVDGWPGLELVSSSNVAAVRCAIHGGAGSRVATFAFGTAGGVGGPALRSTSSNVALFHCTLVAGNGGEAPFQGGLGGTGIEAVSGEVWPAWCTVVGGNGGFGTDFIAACGGDGGAGLFSNLGALIALRSTRVRGGFPGGVLTPGVQVCTPSAGPRGRGAGQLRGLRGIGRSFETTRFAAAGGMLTLDVEGRPGDDVFVGLSYTSAFASAPAGVWLLEPAAWFNATIVGALPASGRATFQVPVPAPAAGLPADALRVQVALREQGTRFFLAEARTVAAIDPAGGADCNTNGRSDLLDVLEGTSADCNGNFVPDPCDIAGGAALDCNGNGVPDTCDLASGTSQDINTNGVPDECEFNARTWFVDAAAAPGGDGSSATPFDDLADAISVADHYDTIALAAGTYRGARNRDVEILRAVSIVGAGSQATVFDLEGVGRLARIFLPLGEVAIERIGVANGAVQFSSPFGGTGGALLLSGNLRVRESVFEDCTATTQGGALRVYDGELELRDCRFSRNTCGSAGGAAYVHSASVRIVGSTFESNTAQGSDGGGVALLTTAPQPLAVISHSRFLENEASRFGGGLYGFGQVPLAVHECLFAGNAASEGGGLYSESSLGTTVSGCTIVGSSGGGAWLRRTFEIGGVANCVLWNNGGGPELLLAGHATSPFFLGHSIVEGGLGGISAGAGIGQVPTTISGADPLFRDPDGADNDPLTFGDNDYRLGAGSPAIDSGNVARIPADRTDVDLDDDRSEQVPLDLDGRPRRTDDPAVPDTGPGMAPIVDMGAYER